MESSAVIEAVEKLGFPIFMATILVAGIYFILKWMMSTLLAKINANNEISVKLIDRIRALDNSIIRLETMVRILHDLPPDWDRIGKQNPEDRRSD